MSTVIITRKEAAAAVSQQRDDDHADAWDLFTGQIDKLFDSFPTHFIEHPWSDITALCWAFVGIMCIVAVFYHSVRDTVLERIAFMIMSLGALGRAFYIFGRGEIETDAAWTAIGAAFYICVLIWKHRYVIPRRPDYKPPQQMPKY